MMTPRHKLATRDPCIINIVLGFKTDLTDNLTDLTLAFLIAGITKGSKIQGPKIFNLAHNIKMLLFKFIGFVSCFSPCDLNLPSNKNCVAHGTNLFLKVGPCSTILCNGFLQLATKYSVACQDKLRLHGEK